MDKGELDGTLNGDPVWKIPSFRELIEQLVDNGDMEVVFDDDGVEHLVINVEVQRAILLIDQENW